MHVEVVPVLIQHHVGAAHHAAHGNPHAIESSADQPIEVRGPRLGHGAMTEDSNAVADHIGAETVACVSLHKNPVAQSQAGVQGSLDIHADAIVLHKHV